MGSSVSTNVASDMITATTNILSKYNQDCSVTTTQQQQIILDNCPNASISDINAGATAYTNVSCLQNASTTAAISNDITQSLKQASEAVTQNFGIPSRNTASNLAQTAVTLGNTIQTSYTSTCSTLNQNKQSIICNNSNNVVIANVSADLAANTTANCILTVRDVQTASSNISQAVEQSAIAKQENVLNGLVSIIFIIVLFFLLFIGG